MIPIVSQLFKQKRLSQTQESNTLRMGKKNCTTLLSRILCCELNISTRTALSPQDHWSMPAPSLWTAPIDTDNRPVCTAGFQFVWLIQSISNTQQRDWSGWKWTCYEWYNAKLEKRTQWNVICICVCVLKQPVGTTEKTLFTAFECLMRQLFSSKMNYYKSNSYVSLSGDKNRGINHQFSHSLTHS